MESKTQIHVMVHYWTSSISAGQASALADTILATINQALAEPSQKIGQLDLFSDRDRDLLSQWNPVLSPDQGRLLHHLIEEQAASKPLHAVAVTSNEGSLTYHQLNEMANKLSHHLSQLGVSPEVIVPCCFEKSTWAIVAMLAVLKAGAACVALDPALPTERRKLIIRDTDASFILTSVAQSKSAEALDANVISVSQDTIDRLPQPPVDGVPDTGVRPDNAAFIVYTSGSTGTPKGAVLEHRNLYAFSTGDAMPNMTSESRVAHFASYAYDVSIEETILTLTRGACVCIISDDDRLADLPGALNQLQVNWADLTPTVLRMLEPRNLPYLKTVVLGGELLTDDVIAKWHNNVQIFNSYGPCECAIACCATEALKIGDRGAIIGKPKQANIWIVDAEDDQRMVPVGAIGELCITGPLVGRGYLKDPVKTKAAFIDAPSWARGSDTNFPCRFYKTGDLARWNADGTITYMGRKDNQTKIHGQRIELGEIEYQVTSGADARISGVVAAVPSSGRLKQRLVVLMAVGDEQPSMHQDSSIHRITDQEQLSIARRELVNLSTSLKKNLPQHMVPNLWIFVYKIPTLPSGKTNRRLVNQWLDSMDQETYTDIVASSQEPTAVVPPSSEMEKTLLELLSQILDLPAPSISMDQSFVALGGDSVLAMKFLARCRANGIIAQLRDVFQQTSISALASCCTVSNTPTTDKRIAGLTTSHTTSIQEDLGINNANVEDIYPASPMQESIVRVQQTRNAWYANWVVEIRPSSKDSPPVQMADVAKSWQQVVNMHPILRTFFQTGTQSGQVYQVVLRDFSAPISYLAESPDAVNDFELLPDMPADGTPPHRIVLAESASGAVLLQLQISHALYDAVSLSILWHDLQVAYTQGLSKEPRPAYRSFISYLGSLDRSQTIAFWRDHLTSAQSCQFPSNNKSPSADGHISESFTSATVPFHKTDQVRALCKKYAITTANLFQAVWALVLRQYTGLDDVCFGFMLSGRDAPIPSVDAIAGPLINLMPCRVKMSQETKLESLFLELQTNLAETLMVRTQTSSYKLFVQILMLLRSFLESKLLVGGYTSRSEGGAASL